MNPAPAGLSAARVVRFAGLLRGAGLPAGPDRTVNAVEALAATAPARPDDVFWLLHAHLVSAPEHTPVFARLFCLFWGGLPARGHLPPPEDPENAAPAAQAGGASPADRDQGEKEDGGAEGGQALTWSAREALRRMDFADMSAEEMAEAERAVAAMELDVETLPGRRLRPAAAGDRIDRRALVRRQVRMPGGPLPLPRARLARRPPVVVLLCDVSGSMIDYGRMMIHLAHALTATRRTVHSFTFGTRLTNVTRDLRRRDVAASLASVARTVEDWSGGTRIGECLRTFNRDWARRVLGQGAVVVLVTDGLDRDVGGLLGREMAMLRRSCRTLVWLNPLLRWDGFRPRTWGIRTMLPHVDVFRTCHNLASLEDLAGALGGPLRTRPGEMERWLKAM